MKSCLFVIIAVLVMIGFIGTAGTLFFVSKDSKPASEENADSKE